MPPEFLQVPAKNPFADPVPLKWYERPVENAIFSTFILILVWLFWHYASESGREKGRHETMKEISRIAEDHDLLLQYLLREGY